MSAKQDKPEQKVAEAPVDSPKAEAATHTFYFPEQDVKVEAATLEEATKKATESREKEGKE